MWSPFVRSTYNLAFGLLLLLALPWLLVRLIRRGGWRRQFGQRFGRFEPPAITAKGEEAERPLWLHAVSVGEANLVTRFALLLQERLPGSPIIVSTTTTTGMAVLQRQLPPSIKKIYYPLDLRGWVRRSLAAVRPRAILLVEAEIWPNFLWQAHDAQIPVLLVNARVSERSQSRYQQLAFVFKPLFSAFRLVCCASPPEAARLMNVGVRPEALEVVGNLKFDLADPDPSAADRVQALLARLQANQQRTILLGGSTHPGEEAILGRLYTQLRERFPDLFLVVAPRHFERANDACRDLQSLGLEIVRRTQLDAPSTEPPGPFPDHVDALVVDTTGELRAFYSHADIVFMGKSLAARGGQNPIEPAAAGCAIITGPHMQNFAHVMTEFLAADALLQVRDVDELRSTIERLLTDPDGRRALGQRATRVVEAGRGALGRTVDAVLPKLQERGAP